VILDGKTNSLVKSGFFYRSVAVISVFVDFFWKDRNSIVLSESCKIMKQKHHFSFIGKFFGNFKTFFDLDDEISSRLKDSKSMSDFVCVVFSNHLRSGLLVKRVVFQKKLGGFGEAVMWGHSREILEIKMSSGADLLDAIDEALSFLFGDFFVEDDILNVSEWFKETLELFLVHLPEIIVLKIDCYETGE